MAVMIVFVKNYLDATATWEQMQDKEMFVWHCPINNWLQLSKYNINGILNKC